MLVSFICKLFQNKGIEDVKNTNPIPIGFREVLVGIIWRYHKYYFFHKIPSLNPSENEINVCETHPYIHLYIYMLNSRCCRVLSSSINLYYMLSLFCAHISLIKKKTTLNHIPYKCARHFVLTYFLLIFCQTFFPNICFQACVRSS